MDVPADRAILVVTGAHLRAEVMDRPVAYALAERLRDRLVRAGHSSRRNDVVVCSDIWYLNQEPLRSRPTISVGGPSVNALTAYLADKLPSVLVVEDVYIVQAEPEMDEPVACLWGADAEATAMAADAFASRFLDVFTERAVGASV